MMKPSDMPWKLSQSKTLNGYTFRIESADGLTIGEFYGSTNTMWDSVPGARQAQENAMLVIDASCRIAELEKQLIAAQQRTAEACAKLCDDRSDGWITSVFDTDELRDEDLRISALISNGEWRKYL